MNSLMVFEGNNVIIEEINGELMFEIYSTGAALGYARWTKSKGKDYYKIEKSRINKVLENAEISTLAQGEQTFITESQLYDFMLEARTDKCRSFRKWVTSEVLPSIRQNGGYIDSSATLEQVEKLVENYSMKAITKKIHESEIMELENIVQDILDTNTKGGKKNRADSRLKKLDSTEYKQHLRQHIRKAIETKPWTKDIKSHGVELAIRDRLIIELTDDVLETTRRSFGQKGCK